ncbi:MAG TPA: pilus assembly protein N-terminal domain-containing protein, partial [Roseiarcus sp.]|nr:pilus assembly protein N-terminal domain-containing protein [Roseiarcus sp.]
MNRNNERTGAVRKARAWTKGLAALALVGGLGAYGPAAAGSDDAAQAASITVARGAVKNLQLGVGRSMIVDLPEDAREIFVGDPKIANAIVRSARRLYISTLAAGQTTIFALGPDGRKIAVLEITVGRDVGELSRLLKAAIPNNDIHVRTVGGSIILTGSVASAGDAQQALDIAQGFVADGGLSAVATGGMATTTSNPAGKVINSLMIRGLDQVSLRVTISEIRRDVLK